MKLLIVDDERHVIEYIKHIMDWQKLGFGEVLTATKSQEAQMILIEEKPNLMITDIKMPGLSGLDLTKEVVERDLPTKVIILSGFSDFSYAQQAIRYGIVDYLIKPITKKDLEPAVKRALTSAELSNRGQLMTLRDRNSFFLKHLNSIEPQEDNQIEKMFIITGDGPHYRMLNLRIDNNYITVIPQRYASEFSDYVQLGFSKNILRKIFSQFLHSDEQQLPLSRHLVQMIRAKRWNDLRNTVEKSEQSVFGTQATIDLFWLLSQYFPQLLDTMDLSELLNSEEHSDFFQTFLDSLHNLEDVPQENREYAEEIVQQMLIYIDEHFNEEISLDQLGEKFHMHPVTISKNFKAITGGTFVNYLKKSRMEEASRLLIHSNLLVSDIANLVGYKTARYFSDIFKNAYGLTPQKYRRKMQKKGNIEDEF